MGFVDDMDLRILGALAVWLGMAGGLPAQSQAKVVVAVPMGFDLAVIKVNKTATDGHTHVYQHTESGEYTAVNISLKNLLEYAYDLPERQIVGAPAWADTVHFDVEAKSSEAVDAELKALDARSPDEARQAKQRMVRALLEERFGLKGHEEMRELPVYALVVAKSGAMFKPSQQGGTDIGFGVGATRGHVSDRGCSMAVLADQLARAVERPVVDKTAMTGRYDFAMEWLPDSAPASAESSLVSIFTAVQEQLGLKLEAAKGPVMVAVLDEVRMPTEN